VRSNGWDIYARLFSPSGAPQGLAFRLNEHTYGDQFAPRISSLGANQLVIWSSLGQDKGERILTRVDLGGNVTSIPTGFNGSVQSVYGRLLSAGVPAESEFRVSTNFVKRLHPEVAADSVGRFLVTWSGFGVASGYDLFSRCFNTTSSADSTNLVAAQPAAAGANDGAGGAGGSGGANAGPASVGSTTSGATGWRVSLSGPLSKMRLNWSSDAGASYQVQTSSDLRNWTNLAAPRSGTGASDSVAVDANGTVGFLRVLKLP
jgi:hypothetical protein